MKAAEREAARQRQRELEELAVRNMRRANRLIAIRTVAGMVGFSIGLPLTRMLVRHEPFSWAAAGETAAAYAAVTALIWGGYFAWERWRRT